MIAGANRVVQPYSSAGTVMAQLALQPQVAAVLDLVSKHSGADLRFEEIEVGNRLRRPARSANCASAPPPARS